MIIGTAANLSFVSFLANMAPAVVIVLCALVALVPRLFPEAFTVDAEHIADVMSLDEHEAIRNHRLLIQCGIVSSGCSPGSSRTSRSTWSRH